MSSTFTFRSTRRLAVAALVVSAIAVGCGAKVAVDRDGGVIGIGGAGGDGLTVGTGFGGNGAHDGGCMPTTTGVGAGQTQLTSCFAAPPEGCPNQYNAVIYIVPSSSCVYLVSVDCGPIVASSTCCYLVTEESKACE